MSSKSARRATALLLATAATSLTIHAADPVVVWDGAAEGYKFDTLTRTVGDNTYTLTVNANTVASDSSYIQIADANQLKGVVLSAVNTDTSVTNAFGTTGNISVIMKVKNCYVSDSANRMLIGLMDGNLYKDGGTSAQDNGAVIGFCGCGTTSRLVWKGGAYNNSSVQVADALTSDEMTVALTYSATGGTVSYVDGTSKSSSSSLKWGSFTTPCGIMLGGLDVDGSGTFYGMRGMQIEALAVFTNTLSATEILSYSTAGFPSYGKIALSGETNVSEINTLAGNATEITVFIPAGYTIHADTQYTATTVNFESNGEYYIFPPENNTANLVNKAGKLIMMYTSVPSVTGTCFTSNSVPTTVTDSSSWTNTVCLKGVAFKNFETNPYGNESSVVRLEDCSGWVMAPGNYVYTNSVPLDIKGTLTLNDGNSINDGNQYRSTYFSKVSGTGTILGKSSADKVVVLIEDASEFTGSVQLNNKVVVFGDTLPAYSTITAGTIVVQSDTSVTNSSGFWWAVNGMDIHGELCAPVLRNSGQTQGFGGGTAIRISDTGVFTLTSTASSIDDTDLDYSNVTGTGTLQYMGTGYRAISTNNFPTTVTFKNEQAGDVLLTLPITYTCGSLAGSCNLQGNYGDNKRYLRVMQAKDTEWSGTIKEDGYARFGGIYVAPGAETAGTLTLSGTQTQSAILDVETNAIVNLTGTWVGTVTAYGSLKGTGTITGDLVLTDGSSLVISDISDMLTISGSLTATGSISIYLPAGTDPKDVAGKVISAGSTPNIDGASFSIYIGDTLTGMLKIRATSEGLKFGSNFGTVIRLR